MDTDPFIGTKPDLISQKLIKDIELKLNDNVVHSDDNTNHIVSFIGGFYKTYLEPNLFPLIVISLLVIYLAVKYVLKVDKDIKSISTENLVVVQRVEVPKPDMHDIASHISDDYLLTEEENKEPPAENDIVTQQYIYQYGENVNRKKIDDATKLIFS